METSVDFIPKSAQIQFELNVTTSVSKSEPFSDIKEAVMALISKTQDELKLHIFSAAKLEQEILRDFAHSLRVIVAVFHAGETTFTVDNIITRSIIKHHTVLLKTCNCTWEQFRKEYVKIHKLGEETNDDNDDSIEEEADK